MIDSQDPVTLIFWICAIAGSVFFILSGALSIMAGTDFDIGADVDLDVDGIDGHNTEGAFKTLSVNSLLAFILMYGWAGLAAYQEFQVGPWWSVLIAFLVGLFSLFATVHVFRLAYKLKSDGAKFDKTEIIGKTATVYHQIPAEGMGRIQISVGGFMRELEATSAEGVEIQSFENVEVVELLDQHTVSVKSINQ